MNDFLVLINFYINGLIQVQNMKLQILIQILWIRHSFTMDIIVF